MKAISLLFMHPKIFILEEEDVSVYSDGGTSFASLIFWSSALF